MGCNETRPERPKPESSASPESPNQPLETEPESPNSSGYHRSLEEIKGEVEKWKYLAQENIQQLHEVTLRFSEMMNSHEEMHMNYKQLEQMFVVTANELREEIKHKLLIEDEFRTSQDSLNELAGENEQLRLAMGEVQSKVIELARRKGIEDM